MERSELTGEIIGGGIKVHRTFGPGFLESVYKNALTVELRSRGLRVERERRLQVQYEGMVVGEFVADIVVDDVVVVEVKAVRAITPAHEAQLVNYLTAVRIETGLLLNFGSDRLEFKRKARTYRPRRVRDPQEADTVNEVDVPVRTGLASCQTTADDPPASS